MSWYDGIGGAVVGGLASIGTSFLQAYQGNSSNKKAASRNYKYYKRSLYEGPEEQRAGLEKAGYNPMLALGGIGSSSYSSQIGGVTPAPADIVGSAKMGAMVENAIKEQKARIKNVEADTRLKQGQLSESEARRLQDEASTSLINSQTERSDLAYGRDIADTVMGIAGTASSLYSAKAMADVAKQNAMTNSRNADVNARNQLLKEAGNERSRTVQRYDKHGKLISTDEITESANPMIKRGVPSVDSSAKGSRPSAAPHVGSSAKSVGRIAKEVFHNWGLPLALFFGKKFALPAAVAGAAYSAYGDHEKTNRTGKHYERSYKDKPYSFSPLR